MPWPVLLQLLWRGSGDAPCVNLRNALDSVGQRVLLQVQRQGAGRMHVPPGQDPGAMDGGGIRSLSVYQGGTGGEKKNLKSILFNTNMVRAILEGRKTVTRRIVRAKEVADVLNSPARLVNSDVPDWKFINCLCTAPCEPGDILWVRETWANPSETEIKRGANPKAYIYKADAPLLPCAYGRWRPSIHMPREAARIFLRVTDVRAERLQDITPEQIDAEGCKEWAYSATPGELLPSGLSWFRIAWNNTIKPNSLATCGWESNPWVWVIEFARCEEPGRS